MSIICLRCHNTKPLSGFVPPCDNPEHPVGGAHGCEWAPGIDLSTPPRAIEAASIREQRSALIFAAAECVRMAWDPADMIDAPKAERRRLAAAAEFRLRAACDRLKAISDGLKPAASRNG